MTVQEAAHLSTAGAMTHRRSVWAGDHVGRAFEGHEAEDGCPCPKAECGLVLADEIRPDCRLHHEARSMRQSHPARRCPGSE